MKDDFIPKKVLIAGAGPAGLVALKEMLAAGHDALIVEKSPSFGGVFQRGNKKVYENLYLTTSNMHMSFSDFPPLEPTIKYSSKKEYCEYLEAYVNNFDLEPHIAYNSEVRNAKMGDDDKWMVTVAHSDKGEVTYQAENLIVATGSYQIPNMLPFPGFAGKKMHSSEYTNNEEFKDKKVLVVGIGESASDIAAEVCEVAASTTVWSRRPFLIAPRFPLVTMNNDNYDEHKMLTDEPEKYQWVSDFLEFGTISRLANSMSMACYAALRILLFNIWNTGFVGSLPRRLSFWVSEVTKRNNYWQQDQTMVATKNSRLATMSDKGNLDIIVSKSMQSDGHTVTFPETVMYKGSAMEETSKSFEFDAIISCSGYQTRFDWLEADIDFNPRTWFKHCFAPGYGQKLMFLGWARPHQGGIPACAEMLSRYGALLISGDRQLPADYEHRALKEGRIERAFYSATPDLNTLVDYPAFMESVAKLTGCKPKAPSIFNVPMFFKYWVYPNWSFWYRKNGPHANPQALKTALDKVPMSKSFKFGDGLGYAIAQFLLILISLPVYLISWVVRLFTGSNPEKLRFGWISSKPKVKILHGNG